jgi:hypothetical protein
MGRELERRNDLELRREEDAELLLSGFIATLNGDAVLQLELSDKASGKTLDRIWKTVGWDALDVEVCSTVRQLIAEAVIA